MSYLKLIQIVFLFGRMILCLMLLRRGFSVSIISVETTLWDRSTFTWWPLETLVSTKCSINLRIMEVRSWIMSGNASYFIIVMIRMIGRKVSFLFACWRVDCIQILLILNISQFTSAFLLYNGHIRKTRSSFFSRVI